MASALPLRGLRLDDELYQKIVFIAKLEDRSFNQEATYILKRFVSEYERSHGAIPVSTAAPNE